MGYFKYLKKLKALRDISTEDLLNKVGLSFRHSASHYIPAAIGFVTLGAILGAGAVWALCRKGAHAESGCCCCSDECDKCYGTMCSPCHEDLSSEVEQEPTA